MRRKALYKASVMLVAALVPASIAGCVPPGSMMAGGYAGGPPPGCSLGVSNAAIYTGVGAAGGAAIGAAASNGNPLYTALGAGIGGILGGAYGQSVDSQCHQYAVQQALQAAYEEDAYERQERERRDREEAAARRAHELRVERHYRYELAKLRRRQEERSYKPVVWKTNTGGGTVRPERSSTDPATNEACYSGNDSGTPFRYCRNAQGNWVPATS